MENHDETGGEDTSNLNYPFNLNPSEFDRSEWIATLGIVLVSSFLMMFPIQILYIMSILGGVSNPILTKVFQFVYPLDPYLCGSLGEASGTTGPTPPGFSGFDPCESPYSFLPENGFLYYLALYVLSLLTVVSILFLALLLYQVYTRAM